MKKSQSSYKGEKPSFFSPIFLIVIAVLLLGGTALTFFIAKNPNRERITGTPNPFQSNRAEFKRFSSENEFRNYLDKSRNSATTSDSQLTTMGAPAIREESLQQQNKADSAPDRISGTNVQVMGIDEPDMIKNNNKNIFYSQQGFYSIGRFENRVMMESMSFSAPQMQIQQQIQIFNAFPAETLAKIGKIDKAGDLLLQDNVLLVLASDAVYGFDISNPTQPQEKWKIELKEGNYVAQSRMYNSKLYLVLQKGINITSPCPLKPAVIRGQEIIVPCGEIYHPASSINADATYTTLKINPNDGTTEKSISFVGSASGSTLYMSPNALYVGFANQMDTLAFLSNFADEKASDIIPEDVRNKIKRLREYDISYDAKMVEINQILQSYFYNQNRDDQLQNQTEMEKRLKEYADENKRDLSSTQIVKIDANNLTQTSTSVVPGTLLNQFSLDEHNENLRVAVTVGGFAWMTQGETANDLYILGKDLQVRGQIKDMGKTERIYSARFIQDKAYLVTFRQIDPFYVLDLSNPDSPQIKGELKIPGFSSYLHPLKDNLIVGIGMEENSLKASLFDVADPTNPKEVSKYTFKDYSSDVLQNHHAFLHDAKNEIFFVPGTEGGYVLSYKNSTLSLVKAVAINSPQRALYMNDFLYVIGNDEIVVYNETNWSEVKRLKLEKEIGTTIPSPELVKPLPLDLPQTRSFPGL